MSDDVVSSCRGQHICNDYLELDQAYCKTYALSYLDWSSLCF